ncbi:MAG: hypothetical protein LBB08_02210 [Rickettsiales bacterium]|nr:hypothetical protein [Rickettsiales bacterium]
MKTIFAAAAAIIFSAQAQAATAKVCVSVNARCCHSYLRPCSSDEGGNACWCGFGGVWTYMGETYYGGQNFNCGNDCLKACGG